MLMGLYTHEQPPSHDDPLSVRTTALGVEVENFRGHVFGIRGLAKDTDGLYTVSLDGIGINRVPDASLADFLNNTGPFGSYSQLTRMPLAEVCDVLPMEVDAHVPAAMRALGARQAVLRGQEHRVKVFSRDVLGLWYGEQWQEAVSTALLGAWANTFHEEGSLGSAALDDLKQEARLIHCQLRPLWQRHTDGSPVLLLDTPLTSDGMTLHDLVASTADLAGPDTQGEPEDARLAAVLRNLHPMERAVALAWAQPWVFSWTEAAAGVGAEDPVALGERVRRKLKRIGALHTARAAAAAARGGSQ